MSWSLAIDICNVRSMSSFADLQLMVNMGDNCDNNESLPSPTVLMFTSHPADIDALHVNKQLSADK